MRTLLLLFLVLFCTLSAEIFNLRQQPVNMSDSELYEENQIFIKFSNPMDIKNKSINTGDTVFDAFLKKKLITCSPAIKIRVSDHNKSAAFSRIIKAEVNPGEINNLLIWLNNNKLVEYAEKVPKVFFHATPNDEFYDNLQHLPQIMAEQAWDIHKGENGTDEIIIAIVDSGVFWRHPDLIDNIWNNPGEDADNDGHTIEFISNTWQFDPGDINNTDDDENGFVDDFIGWDFVNENFQQDNDPTDVMSHGTHCAGISAGRTNNSAGISSISWNIKIMCLKHDRDGGNAFESNTYDGIVYAAENGADVVNTSWGCNIFSRVHEEVIEYATSLGTIVVSSAGNSDWEIPGYPSSYPGVLSVASVASNDEKAYYSCYGIAVDISAPGGDVNVDGGIYSTVINNNYANFQGTSMASPLVVGTLGLLKSYHPGWTNEQILHQLLATCDNIDPENPGFEEQLGSGRINAYRMLSENNPTLSPKFRLQLTYGETDSPLFPGNEIFLSLTILNYAMFTEGEVTFTLECNDPRVSVTEDNCTVFTAADAYTELNQQFILQIDENAENGLVDFVLHATSETDISHGQTMEFSLPVTSNSGVFVWENLQNGADMSGAFICEQLQDYDIDYDYSSSFAFPLTLLSYEAVFLSFGTPSEYPYYDNPPNFDDHIAEIVDDYLLQGGRVYLEGNNMMIFHGDSLWLPTNEERLHRFGLTDVEDGSANSISSLIGQTGSVAENMIFHGTSQSNSSIDIYFPLTTAESVFIEDNYGITTVQNIGQYGQKTICSSYSIGRLNDYDDNSNKHRLFRNILEFLEVSFVKADFASNYTSGHAPLVINFSDQSSAYPPVNAWEWDFNADNITDTYQENPQWTFSAPGIYPISLSSSNSTISDTVTKEGYLRVFDGTSSLSFETQNGFADIPASVSLELTDSFTFEAWIKPSDWGPVPNAGMGTIFSKGNTCIFLINNSNVTNDRTLVFWFYNDLSANTFFYTDSDMIEINEWQYIAVTYASTGVCEMYIDGVNVPVYGQLDGDFSNNESMNVHLGNNSANNKDFGGLMDEIRLWNTIRSENQILENMESYLSGDENGLIGYWKANEGQSDLLNDYSTNDNDGTLNNVLWYFGAPFENTQISGDVITPADPILINYPNPFNPVTKIEFYVPVTSQVELEIFNIKGQRVKVLANNQYEQGYHELTWKGKDESERNVGSGVYFYRLKVNNKTTAVKKCLLLK